jgi:hypothetical protein
MTPLIPHLNPYRLLLPHLLPSPRCRSLARLRHRDQWVLRSSFPSITAEYQADWAGRIRMAHPFVFDRAVFADRAAAMQGYNYHRTQRTAANVFALGV